MPVKAVRITPVSKAVPVPGSTTLSFSATRTGGDDAPVVVLYSVMDGAEVRITGGGQASPAIGASSTTVAQRVDFDRTENPTPMAFRVRAVVSENGVEQFERIWPIRVDSTALAEAMLETGQVPGEEPRAPEPRRRGATKTKTKTKSASKKRAGTAGKKAATAKKSATKKSATKKGAAKKSAAKKGAAKKGATKKGAGRKTAARKGGAKRSVAKRGATAKRASSKRRAR